ncbi:hypothetical protein [Clostridium tunisiense]|uniref:hypothetical protein n=1 Tax=Clostridium tunisiense TaxID=219748 RepID=UPI00030FB800|nr:hypothetical protein [Clostridium tunisiense]
MDKENKNINKFMNLIEIKKIIALTLTLVFCYLSITKSLAAEQFLTVFSLVIAFYFGQSTARQANREGK